MPRLSALSYFCWILNADKTFFAFFEKYCAFEQFIVNVTIYNCYVKLCHYCHFPTRGGQRNPLKARRIPCVIHGLVCSDTEDRGADIAGKQSRRLHDDSELRPNDTRVDVAQRCPVEHHHS